TRTWSTSTSGTSAARSISPSRGRRSKPSGESASAPSKMADRTTPWRSVRVRITAASVVVFALAFGAASWALVTSVQRALVDQIDGEQQGTAARISDSLAMGVPPPDALGPGTGMFVCRVEPPGTPGAGETVAGVAGS